MFRKPQILVGAGVLVLILAVIIVTGFSGTDLTKYPDVAAAQQDVDFDIREILPSWLPRGMDLAKFELSKSEMPQGDTLYTMVLSFTDDSQDRSMGMTVTRRPVEIQEGSIQGTKVSIGGNEVYTRDVGNGRTNWTFVYGHYHVTIVSNNLSDSQMERFIRSIF